MVGRVQPSNGRADVVDAVEDTPLVVREFGDDPFKIHDLTLLELCSRWTHGLDHHFYSSFRRERLSLPAADRFGSTGDTSD
jgi:hypothetical protein